MKTIVGMICIGIISCMVGFSVCEAEESPVAFNNDTCPVMGGPVSTDYTVTHNGVVYALCCPGCEEIFQKDPATYLAKLPHNGAIVDAKNTKCPVMGGPVSSDISVVANGLRVHLCCEGCVAAFAKQSTQYIKKLSN